MGSWWTVVLISVRTCQGHYKKKSFKQLGKVLLLWQVGPIANVKLHFYYMSGNSYTYPYTDNKHDINWENNPAPTSKFGLPGINKDTKDEDYLPIVNIFYW